MAKMPYDHRVEAEGEGEVEVGDSSEGDAKVEEADDGAV
jgi:hypothetical protein